MDLVDTLTESYPATADSLAVARRAVAALAWQAGATDEQLDDVRLALSEAMTNVILHAYPRDPASPPARPPRTAVLDAAIHVTAAVAGGELWLLVADDGGGLRPNSESAGLGLGLALITHASDGLTIVTRSGGGTEVRMRFRLGGVADQSRGSVASANSPARSVFSTMT